MVTGSITGGNTAVGTDEKTRKMIRLIKEIVGNHSDADIFAALEETNMDADEAVQKLIYQDTFHEVKRKKDKKKEETKVVEPAEKRNSFENPSREVTSDTQAEHNVSRGTYNHNKLPRNAAPRNAFPKNPAAGPNREFRVVSDNRSKLNANKELKNTSVRLSGPSMSGEAVIRNEKGSSGGSGDHQTYEAHVSNAPAHARSRQIVNVSLRHSTRKELSEGRQTVLEAIVPSSNSILGVYSSSADPVHVPSPYSRSSAVGAIRREAKDVSFGGKPSGNVVKDSSAAGSLVGSLIRKDGSPKAHRPFVRISNIDHGSRTKARETAIPNHRSLLNSQHGNRHHQYVRTKQQAGGLSKGSQNKRWKPKSNQKSNNAEVIETSENSRTVDDSGNLESEIVKLQDNLSLVSISESQNVIIADRIRVPEINRCQLTFGSFVLEVDLPKNSASGLEEAYSSHELKCGDPDDSLPTSPPKASTNGTSNTITAITFHSEVGTSGAGSPPPVLLASEQLFSEQKEAPKSQNLDEYAQTELLSGNSSSAVLEQKQQQVPFQLHNFPDYNPQEGYDLPVFRQVTDDNGRIQEQGLPSLPEQSLNPHMFNNVPASTMLQQQHAPMTQMYPQVHVSHFPNGMPYHQFLSPVYVPQMPMQGYTGNPAAYTHPTNSSSYVVMPGGSSHPSANGLKFGIQPLKQVPAGAPASFGTFNNPNGYQISSHNAQGFEDSYRLKFKDRNAYVPNPQAENSEIWMQNPRDLSGLQSPYYNMAGQTPHGAYLSSFNSPPVQASNMQFQGVFHSQQPDPMANPHHMGLGLDGNAGLRVAPSPSPVQVGAYRQPELGHINWPANF